MNNEKQRKIKNSSKKIIELLQAGVSQRQIALKGYSVSTITYYYRKLFKPERYERFIKQVKKSQSIKKMTS